MRETDIGWLAGIIDGEGSLALAKSVRGTAYSPRLSIAASSQSLIDKFVRICRELGAPSTHTQRKIKSNKLSDKPQYQVQLCKRDELLSILRLVEPHLTEKQAFCRAILEFYEDRQPWVRWTEEDVAWLKEIRSAFMPRTRTTA